MCAGCTIHQITSDWPPRYASLNVVRPWTPPHIILFPYLAHSYHDSKDMQLGHYSPGPGPPAISSTQNPLTCPEEYAQTAVAREGSETLPNSPDKDPLKSWQIWQEKLGLEPKIPAITAQSPFVASVPSMPMVSPLIGSTTSEDPCNLRPCLASSLSFHFVACLSIHFYCVSSNIETPL